MEIQKIFSDEYNEERLYSVLMTEEEVELFSELQKEFNSKAMKILREKSDLSIGKKYMTDPATSWLSFYPKNKVGFKKMGRVLQQTEDSGLIDNIHKRINSNASSHGKFYKDLADHIRSH